MSAVKLVLASASPRRSELLRQIGVEFSTRAQDIDESAQSDELPEQLVQRLARQKAEAALQHCNEDEVVLGSDTIVLLGDKVLGKPESADAAVSMLLALADNEHQVLTAVFVADRDRQSAALSKTTVRFRPIQEQEARAYWETGEPQGKAGGYGIQGQGAVFVQSISGSYSGVMGLPLYETAQLLKAFAVPCWLPVEN